MFFLVYVILEAFAGLESRRVARGDFDFFARLRVFAFSCFSFTRFKNSEAGQAEPCRSSLRHPLQRQQMRSMRPRRPFLKGSLFQPLSATNSDLFHRHTSSFVYGYFVYYHRFYFLAIHTDDFCSFERKIAFAFIRKAKKS